MEMNKLIKEEILRYQELMGYPSEVLNESAVSRAAGALKRFSKGALKTVLDQSIALEVKNGINKALHPKRLSQAFLSELVAGKRTIDQLVSKVNPKEVVDKIALGLKKRNINLTKLEKVSLRQEVEQSIKKSLKKPSTDVGFKIYYRSFDFPEKEYFKEAKRLKEAKLGRKLNDKELLDLAKKSKNKRLKKPIIDDGGKPKIDDGGKPIIDDGGRPKIDDGSGKTPIIDGGGRFKKYRRKVKTAWQKIKIRWNSLSRAQRRFWRVAGAALGVGLAVWLYYVLSKEGYCKCLINMLQDSDADYMDSVSMEDAMFLGQTLNSEIDAQGGGIFYLDGKFKSKNGKLQGRYTCNDSGVFITANGVEYKVRCENGVEEELPIPVIEDDEDNDNTNTGNTETIIFKDCEGPEYQLGCTDKGDTIERVQACLRVPVTGKFDKDLEMALLKKLGKKTFTEQDVFIICDIKTTTNFTFG
jgi:hypothetical protein